MLMLLLLTKLKTFEIHVLLTTFRLKKLLQSDLPQLVAKLRMELKDELDKYFLKPSDLQWLAMIVNPVMLTTGLPILQMMLGHGLIVDCSLSVFKEALLEEATCSIQQQQVASDGSER